MQLLLLCIYCKIELITEWIVAQRDKCFVCKKSISEQITFIYYLDSWNFKSVDHKSRVTRQITEKCVKVYAYDKRVYFYVGQISLNKMSSSLGEILTTLDCKIKRVSKDCKKHASKVEHIIDNWVIRSQAVRI